MDANGLNELNAMLQGEMAAVESYRLATDKVSDQQVVSSLRACLKSHQDRVDLLRAAIEKQGGTAETTAGTWGSFTKLVTKASGAVGDKALVASLEEGEDMGLNDYEWRLVKLQGPLHHFVKNKLLSEQQTTHKIVSALTNKNFGGAWPPMPESREV